MTSATSFQEHDRGAANLAAAARKAGVRRIVYLGGLGAGGDLSSHLSSRQEVGRILTDSSVDDDRVPGFDRDRLGQPAGLGPEHYGGVRHGKRLVDSRSIQVRASRAVCSGCRPR